MDFCFELFAHVTKFFGYKVRTASTVRLTVVDLAWQKHCVSCSMLLQWCMTCPDSGSLDPLPSNWINVGDVGNASIYVSSAYRDIHSHELCVVKAGVYFVITLK